MFYRFAGFDLDPARRALERDGRPVAVTAKVFDLLLALVERHDALVTKDDLMSIVWPDTIVEENNLTVTMSALRKALGEQPGEHRFIVTLPGRGYRFVADVVDMGSDRPAAASRPAPGNLPSALSSFVGRDREIAEVTRLLAEDRLLTLTGSGGCGKTRLAIEVARGFERSASGGAWLTKLAPLSDPSLVAQEVAMVFGLRASAQRSPIDVLVDALQGQSLLLVLDNCEHLIDASAHVAETLLAHLPDMRVLVTSRESLGIPGERVWRVPSLGADESRRLFVERATAISPAFAVTESNAEAVAQVCDRLDGIPLALELAAARVGVLSADQIAERLGDQFQLLTGGARTALPRHRTLRASIDWSHDLLSVEEQSLFRRLSVFLGGWTLEGAEHVAVRHDDEARRVLDGLGSLVNKSLVSAEPGPGGRLRYRMLETIRQYARERLTDAGEEEWVRRRHLEFFLAMAERAESEVLGPDAARWLADVVAEHDNFRSALDWTLGRDAESSLRLVASLFTSWIAIGYLREGGERIDAAFNRATPDVSDLTRARALHAAATIDFFRGDLRRMAERSRETLPLARRIGAIPLVAFALVYIACQHQYQDADFDRARPLFDESLALARRENAPFLLGMILIHLGLAAIVERRLDRAADCLGEGLTIARAFGNPWLIAVAVLNAGRLALAKRDHLNALALCRESLRLRARSGDRWGMIESLETLAEIAADQGQAEHATRLLGASAGIGRAIGADVPFLARAAHDRTESRARADLGDARFTAAWSDGLAMPVDRAIALAAPASEDGFVDS